MKNLFCFLILSVMIQFSSGQSPARNNPVNLFDKGNLIAWCIVPFDASGRSPEERVQMLKDLGISQLAYDYRDEHIPSFRDEISALSEHQIKLTAVWLWLDPGEEGLLNNSNELIFKILEETGTKTELWVSFPARFFEGHSDEKKLEHAAAALREILVRAEAMGCTLALYNHGDWFGEPRNQIRIIESIGSDKIRLVYNFHHGHHQVDQFENLLHEMLPYLSAININGMKVEGPKIITLGEGDHELEMLRIIRDSGYRGPIGIIGHTEGEDIRLVLERNLEGLEKLKRKL